MPYYLSKLLFTIFISVLATTTAVAQNGFIMQRWTGAWGSDGPINTGDLNGDGKTDGFMWRNSSRTWMISLSSGSGFTMREWTGAWC